MNLLTGSIDPILLILSKKYNNHYEIFHRTSHNLIYFFQSCATVTIHPEQSGKLSTEPTFEESKNYYFWGLVGEHRFNVKGICGDKKVVQIQYQQTVKKYILKRENNSNTNPPYSGADSLSNY